MYGDFHHFHKIFNMYLTSISYFPSLSLSLSLSVCVFGTQQQPLGFFSFFISDCDSLALSAFIVLL